MTAAFRPCLRCLGDGRVANDAEGPAWRRCEARPFGQSVSPTTGLNVRPVACPECGGSGRVAVRP